MVTGGKKWYYFKNGVMVDGWQKIGSNWYYFKKGTMMDGILTILMVSTNEKNGWKKWTICVTIFMCDFCS